MSAARGRSLRPWPSQGALLRSALAVALVVALPVGAAGQSAAAQMYNAANRLYADGRFAAARDMYLQVAAAGTEDARLFYNLGNAHLKCGALGKAVLWYERARRLAPRDPDIRHNLAFADALKQDREPAAAGAVWGALSAAFAYPTLNELCVATTLALLTLALLCGVRRVQEAPRTAGWVAAVSLAAALLAASGIWLGARLHQRATIREAVLLAPAGQARSGPDAAQTVVFVAHEGTKLRIERQQDGWLLVRLVNGLGGWLPADLVEEI